MTAWIYAGQLSDLLPGEFLSVEVEGVMAAIYNIDGVLYAIEDVCTHDGGELAGGALVGTTLECVRHGAVFDLKTGAALCAPAYTPTAVLETKLESGAIYIRDPSQQAKSPQ
jgi:3-phenylpropionate/trans-cinnamate dioxygenase ferredoxin component